MRLFDFLWRRPNLGKKLKRVIKRDRRDRRMFIVRRMPVELERVHNARL